MVSWTFFAFIWFCQSLNNRVDWYRVYEFLEWDNIRMEFPNLESCDSWLNWTISLFFHVKVKFLLFLWGLGFRVDCLGSKLWQCNGDLCFYMLEIVAFAMVNLMEIEFLVGIGARSYEYRGIPCVNFLGCNLFSPAFGDFFVKWRNY